MADAPSVIQLRTLLAERPDIRDLLADSIATARRQMEQSGIPVGEGVPSDIEGFYAYLNRMIGWIPDANYEAQAYVAVIRFHGLISQPSGLKLQEMDEFRAWLRAFTKDWGTSAPDSPSGQRPGVIPRDVRAEAARASEG